MLTYGTRLVRDGKEWMNEVIKRSTDDGDLDVVVVGEQIGRAHV